MVKPAVGTYTLGKLGYILGKKSLSFREKKCPFSAQRPKGLAKRSPVRTPWCSVVDCHPKDKQVPLSCPSFRWPYSQSERVSPIRTAPSIKAAPSVKPTSSIRYGPSFRNMGAVGKVPTIHSRSSPSVVWRSWFHVSMFLPSLICRKASGSVAYHLARHSVACYCSLWFARGRPKPFRYWRPILAGAFSTA